MNSNRRPLIAVAFIAVAVVAWIVVLRPSRGVNGQYFYDLGTNELYVESVTAVAPVQRASGSEGVHAVVMACRSCDDKADRFIGYLEKNTDEYNKVLASGAEPTAAQSQNMSLIRAADGDAWLPTSDPAAQAIISAAEKRCSPTSPQYCTP